MAITTKLENLIQTQKLLPCPPKCAKSRSQGFREVKVNGKRGVSELVVNI